MNSSVFALLIPIIFLFFLYIKKSKSSKKTGFEQNSGGQGNEVSKTIREFLRKQNVKGVEIVASYSIRRPSPKQMHQRLKEAAIYQAKITAKREKTKYRKPKIPKKYPLEAYFQTLYAKTYQLSTTVGDQKELGANYNLLTKPHRQDLITKKQNQPKKVSWWGWGKGKKKGKKEVIPPDRELYVLIFQTKDVQTRVVSQPRAIEVEIIKKIIDAKHTERKIIINQELDLAKEMAWINPIKDNDDKAAQKEAEKSQKWKAKQRKKYQKWRKNEMWYQKVSPKFALNLVNKITNKTNPH